MYKQPKLFFSSFCFVFALGSEFLGSVMCINYSMSNFHMHISFLFSYLAGKFCGSVLCIIVCMHARNCHMSLFSLTSYLVPSLGGEFHGSAFIGY